MKHVPSNKIPIRDSGFRVSKTGVNLHEIVGIRLDDTSKQGLMHEHVGKRAKMQRCKEAKKTKWVAQSEQGKYNIIVRDVKKYVSSTPTSQRCVSQAIISKQATRGTDATTQASGPKDQQAQAHGGQKA